jgi:hypothetical protein
MIAPKNNQKKPRSSGKIENYRFKLLRRRESFKRKLIKFHFIKTNFRLSSGPPAAFTFRLSFLDCGAETTFARLITRQSNYDLLARYGLDLMAFPPHFPSRGLSPRTLSIRAKRRRKHSLG